MAVHICAIPLHHPQNALTHMHSDIEMTIFEIVRKIQSKLMVSIDDAAKDCIQFFFVSNHIEGHIDGWQEQKEKNNYLSMPVWWHYLLYFNK